MLSSIQSSSLSTKVKQWLQQHLIGIQLERSKHSQMYSTEFCEDDDEREMREFHLQGWSQHPKNAMLGQTQHTMIEVDYVRMTR